MSFKHNFQFFVSVYKKTNRKIESLLINLIALQRYFIISTKIKLIFIENKIIFWYRFQA